jgi:hypothetical protein
MVTAAAERMWAHAVGGSTAPAEVADAADLLCVELRDRLGRWIGAGGYRALLERALEGTKLENPVLDGIAFLGGDVSALEAAVRRLGPEAMSAGLVALLAELVELLGRIIGPEMAVQLVDQDSIPSPRGVVSIRTAGVRYDD